VAHEETYAKQIMLSGRSSSMTLERTYLLKPSNTTTWSVVNKIKAIDVGLIPEATSVCVLS